MDILTLRHDYRVASFNTLYFVVPGINIPKINPMIRSHRNLLLTILTCPNLRKKLSVTYGRTDQT